MSLVQPRILETPNNPPLALLRHGPVLPVTVTITEKEATIRGERPEITVIGLLDTGASGTVISTRVADALQLEKIDECQTVGPHGEAQTCNVHFVDFTFPGSLLNFIRWRVVETDLKGPPTVQGKPLDMLIGRDVLYRAEFKYDGARAGFRLELPSPSHPDHPMHPSNAALRETVAQTVDKKPGQQKDKQARRKARKEAKKAKKRNK